MINGLLGAVSTIHNVGIDPTGLIPSLVKMKKYVLNVIYCHISKKFVLKKIRLRDELAQNKVLMREK